jgi:stage IV sporulation protein B
MDKSLGSLILNTECGVFGILNASANEKICSDSSLLPIGRRDEVKEGEATIISTVKNGKKDFYTISIESIDRNSDGSKSFRIKVTDPALIALTGGIVRGMSGSPIIQDGKLVGAVTHVMVANPTEGYGIFIENMLAATQQGVQPKAA